MFPHEAFELQNKEGAKFTIIGQRVKNYLGHANSVHEVGEAFILMKFVLSRVLHYDVILNQALLRRQPKVYHLANDRFCFLCSSSCLVVLIISGIGMLVLARC